MQVRSKRSGELTLVSAESYEETGHAGGQAGAALFFPRSEEEIVEVQRLMKLSDYECMIMVDQRGVLSFYYGDDAKRGSKPRAFFVPPYHSVYALTWSRGRRRELRDLRIDRIDCRPQFMSFEFNVRHRTNHSSEIMWMHLMDAAECMAELRTTCGSDCTQLC